MIPFIDLKTQQERIRDKIESRIKTVLDHGQYIMGPEVGELESIMQKYIGAKHAIALSSGTDALIIALMALDIEPGDEVIVPDFSFFGTAEVVELLRAKPVFCDVDEKTFNLDPSKLEECITSKTKAIMPVSLYGLPADYDAINAIAKANKITVIEDGAQSFGARYKDRMSLNLTEIGCTSFFPAKPLGCYGDGGAVFTNNDELATKMRQILSHGQENRYHHVRIGLNARMDSIQAAILIEKMAIFEDEFEKRQEVAYRYNEMLNGIVESPLVPPKYQSVWAQYTIKVEKRESVVEKLKAKKVPTSIHYPSVLSQQPALSHYQQVGRCPISERLAQTVLSLPMHPYLEEGVQSEIVQALKEALK